jgi:hypothetical protein
MYGLVAPTGMLQLFHHLRFLGGVGDAFESHSTRLVPSLTDPVRLCVDGDRIGVNSKTSSVSHRNFAPLNFVPNELIRRLTFLAFLPSHFCQVRLAA